MMHTRSHADDDPLGVVMDRMFEAKLRELSRRLVLAADAAGDPLVDFDALFTETRARYYAGRAAFLARLRREGR